MLSWFSTGYVEQEKDGMKPDPVFAREVMKAIEKSIKTFWVFLKTENRRHSWKFKGLLLAHSQVEDPMDLARLADLTKALQKVRGNLDFYKPN